MMIIERPMEVSSLSKGKWILVYGRRKTGKTFLVENFVNYDEFFFVKRDRSIIEKGSWREISYDTLKEIIVRDLEAGKCIVVDEFHRLGDDFLDFIHALPTKGKLILISSTLHTARTLMGRYSPILGRFGEVKIGLINLHDTLRALKNKFSDPKELLEYAIIATEPITINLVEEGMSIEEIFEKLRLAASSLVGEIFLEEDRHLSRIYDGIMRAVSVGKTTSGKISTYLYSRKLIKKDDPSLIQQYLKNLVDFGILYRIPVWSKRRVAYKHISPLLKIFFYMDEKYGVSEREVSAKEMKRYISEIMPRVVEDKIREYLSWRYGMKAYLYEMNSFEIDALYAKFKKPEIAMEIKWKKNITNNELKSIEKKLCKIDVKERILFVPNKEDLKSDKIRILDVQDLY